MAVPLVVPWLSFPAPCLRTYIIPKDCSSIRRRFTPFDYVKNFRV